MTQLAATQQDVFETEDLAEALKPQVIQRRSIIDIMCDDSIDLFGTYEEILDDDGNTVGRRCVKPGRAELRDEYFASLGGYVRRPARNTGDLPAWSRPNDRRFCDLGGNRGAGTGRIYFYKLKKAPYVADWVDGEPITDIGFEVEVYDVGINAREPETLVATIRDLRVDLADRAHDAEGRDVPSGVKTEQPFTNGQVAIRAFYPFMLRYCDEQAERWRQTPACRAQLEKIRAHQDKLAAERSERLQAPVKAAKAALVQASKEYHEALASGDEDLVATMVEVGKARRAEYEAAKEEYQRQLRAF